MKVVARRDFALERTIYVALDGPTTPSSPDMRNILERIFQRMLLLEDKANFLEDKLENVRKILD